LATDFGHTIMAYPDLICLEDFGGDVRAHIGAVYQAYLDELVNARLTFLGARLAFKFTPATDRKGFAFWHAVQEQGETTAEDDRTVDPRRCERITWPAYMIRNARPDGRGDVLWWRVKRGTRTRIVLWLEGDGYALVLEERETFCLFWTTYTVRPGRARTFALEHQAYWRAPWS
jgi:hypothetical protein